MFYFHYSYSHHRIFSDYSDPCGTDKRVGAKLEAEGSGPQNPKP